MAEEKSSSEKREYVMAEIDQPQSDHGKDNSTTKAGEDLPAPKKRMGIVECIRTYKYASFICVLAALGALSDGYQVQMSGSIVALPGFIRQFGDLQSNGKYKINPQYLALWGCKLLAVVSTLRDTNPLLPIAMKNIFAVLGAGIGSYPADKIGRKWMILVVQIVMCGACILEQFATHWTHWLGARFLDVRSYF